MMYRWKEGSMCQNGKIILRGGDFIPEGMLEPESIEHFVKNGSIEAIKEPEIPKDFKKEKKKAGPIKTDEPKKAGPDIKDLM